MVVAARHRAEAIRTQRIEADGDAMQTGFRAIVPLARPSSTPLVVRAMSRTSADSRAIMATKLV
jgi:hypothetical protein